MTIRQKGVDRPKIADDFAVKSADNGPIFEPGGIAGHFP
jgi:hypothetical protein